MSSYFDALASEVWDLAAAPTSGDDFVAGLMEIEERVFLEITNVTGDREFPDDLRQRILARFATQSVWQPGDLPAPEHARDRAIALRDSWLFERLHSIHHELARRRIATRFGRWSDNPNHNRDLRDEHDEES